LPALEFLAGTIAKSKHYISIVTAQPLGQNADKIPYRLSAFWRNVCYNMAIIDEKRIHVAEMLFEPFQ
jgi:hypothetical protein